MVEEQVLPLGEDTIIRLDLNGIALTHSCLENYLTSVVCSCHTFENNFGMNHELAKYLKGSCR